MGVKWMTTSGAATNYPTDGRGGVTSTSSSSSFADTKPWDNRKAALMELVVTAGAGAAATATLTSHDGTTETLPVLSALASTTASMDLHGIEILGIKLVTAGAGSSAMLKFDTGMEYTYTAS